MPLKVKSLTVFLLFSAITVNATASDCSLYLDIEKERQCLFNSPTETDYLTGYGYYYCRSFKKESKSTPTISKFVEDTLPCLQKKIKSKYKEMSCGQIEEYAFQSHPTCYEEGNYCKLTQDQRKKIFTIVAGINVLFKIDKSLLQYMSIVKNCTKEGEYASIIYVFKTLLEDFENLKSISMDYIKSIFFDLPSSAKKIDDFFKKASAILGYGDSSKESQQAATAEAKFLYGSEAYPTTFSQRASCLESDSRFCRENFSLSDIKTMEMIRKQKSKASSEKAKDTNEQIKKIKNLHVQLFSKKS